MRIEVPRKLSLTAGRFGLNVPLPPPPATDEDIDAFTYVQTHDMHPASNRSSLNSLHFKPDGTKVYAGDFSAVVQLDLPTPWDPSTAENQVLQTSPLASSRSWEAITFNTPGTRLYVYNQASSDVVRSIDLRTPFEFLAAGSPQNTNPLAKSIPDSPRNGTSMLLRPNDEQNVYFLDADSTKPKVFHWFMNTPGDVTSLVALSGTAGVLDFSAEVSASNTASSMDWSPNGTKLYIMTSDTDTIFQYDMSVAYDISTAVYSGKSLVLQGFGSPEVLLTFNNGIHVRKDTGRSLFVQHGDNSNFFIDEYAAA